MKQWNIFYKDFFYKYTIKINWPKPIINNFHFGVSYLTGCPDESCEMTRNVYFNVKEIKINFTDY